MSERPLTGPADVPDASSSGGHGATDDPTRPRGRRWDGWGPFARDVGRLLVAVSRDDRVPGRAKVVAGAAAAYVVSPVDAVPDAVPVIGWIDDLIVAAAALRYLLRNAGYGVITDLWRGTDDGLALVLFVGGVDG